MYGIIGVMLCIPMAGLILFIDSIPPGDGIPSIPFIPQLIFAMFLLGLGMIIAFIFAKISGSTQSK